MKVFPAVILQDRKSQGSTFGERFRVNTRKMQGVSLGHPMPPNGNNVKENLYFSNSMIFSILGYQDVEPSFTVIPLQSQETILLFVHLEFLIPAFFSQQKKDLECTEFHQ